ncbi:putative DD41D transposase [Trichonephila clavipes]|uniref:Putative DD41D transposase n=1 Tax=Trichonephila clavipes TaxID=2585209 RepID=A0A8X6V0U2_TRICX|nr:putative DD41D transposase [Trichonephila clavipes]
MDSLGHSSLPPTALGRQDDEEVISGLSSDLFSVWFGIHQNDHQARSRFVEWAQNEIAVVPDFHKRILFSDEAHFWLNGYVNKQNCRFWSEVNPQVYVETPLHPEKLTVWCALWAGGIIGPYFFKKDEGHNITVNGDRYRAMITNLFIPELNNHDFQELWFQQDGATCHTARATIDLLKDTFGERLISRFGPVNGPPRSCDLTPLDYFLWGYVKSLVKTDHTVSVNIKLNQVLLTVINVYFSPHGDFSEAINQLNLYKGINKNCLLAGDFNASLLINTTNASAFSTLRKRRVLNTPSFKWWNNSLRIQRNQLNAYKRRVVSLTTHGMSVDEIAFMHSAAFGKLSSPTNLHQISTGDPASLFHSKVSLLLDSHFPSGSPPIPLVFNDCSPPSCLSPSEVEVVFRKLRGAVVFEGARPSGGIPFLKLVPIPSLSLSHTNTWVSTLTIAYLGLPI